MQNLKPNINGISYAVLVLHSRPKIEHSTCKHKTYTGKGLEYILVFKE